MSLRTLVSAQWLQEHLHDPDLAIVDLRWYLGRPGDGRAAYLAGHIPGAVFCDLDADITAPQGPGRHPLPSREQFEVAMRGLGVGPRTGVVAYDDAGGSTAARLWFLLRWFGHQEVAVLDGGLGAWSGALQTGAESRAHGDFTAVEPDRGRILDHETVAGAAVLLDARTRERYLGEVEPTGVRAGHIPGARSAFWGDNLGPDGRFKSPAELRARFEALGAGGAGAAVYCGSGVTACHDVLALEIAGLPAPQLSEGSYGDWATRPELEIATGDET
jgi:thiosulfate/3-mercaptopyruvate sulfurtransferase